MLALSSVWIGLASLGLALAMLIYRPAMTDLSLTLVLYFGSPGALCFAGMTLWAFRREDASDPGVVARRMQCRAAIVMALLAAAIAYGLVMRAEPIEPIAEQPPPRIIGNGQSGFTFRSTDAAMHVTINGQREALEHELSVAELLAGRRIEPRRVAVEINENIVPRRAFPEMLVRDGDRIEIVTFVGGG